MSEVAEEMQHQERSAWRESVSFVAKLIGKGAIGMATGYALSKGIEQIIPVQSGDATLFEGFMAGAGTAIGVLAVKQQSE